MTWFVASLSETHRPSVLSRLEDLGCEAFNPTVTEIKVHRRSRRKYESIRPFFVGYVFIKVLNDALFEAIARIPGVFGFLGSDLPLRLRESDIQVVRDAVTVAALPEKREAMIGMNVLFDLLGMETVGTVIKEGFNQLTIRVTDSITADRPVSEVRAA